ncbi:CPBP family intramembrane glutamic endopeptidase [Bacillus methanolicus]|uniref:Putative membrane protein n=1 Tax=Bacillus methanolicus (strain MGA3 / ATCC 53907) TaxID=796606 RepID=I3E8Y9_BACMM|nr:type II CAAX endopeptidase family protein [Bacillus methanolicus]AIE60223.1 putative membrane protein [Bacillus methanolicus MGA3]EIJ82960.1 CAAX amino terminal protease family protein [Bacillus methanolicus MGA3]
MHWGKVVIHCLMLIILFLLAAIFVNPLTDGIENGTMRVAVKELLRIGFTVGLLWLYARLFFKKSSGYFRIHKLFETDKIWVFVGLAMPLTVIAFYLLTQFVVFEKQEHFHIESALAFITVSFIMACSAGVIEEILFRGYLFKLIEDKWNAITAVCITSILFGALHLLTVNGLKLVDVCLVLIAGSLVGIMFSLIVYKTGNVWNAVVVHIIWNFFMNSQMVQFAPVADRSHSSLVMLRLKSDSVWITGGTFGIEVALPVVVLYVLIICWIGFRKTNVRRNTFTF